MKDIIVIDNFYKNPHAVRQLALTAPYHLPKTLSPNYAGKESQHSYYTDKVINTFEEVIGSKIEVDLNKNVFGRFRSATTQNERKTYVHFDDIEWSAVVYLTLDENCNGGTAFFKHKETSLLGPPDSEMLRNMGFQSIQMFEENVVLKDTLDPDKWSIDIFVPMKFNRLVLFKGSERFHGYSLFGETEKDARLTQLFFFNTKESL